MTRIWKSLWTVAVAASLLTSVCASAVVAQDDAPGAEKEAVEQQEKTEGDEIEFDESEPADKSDDSNAL